jgi:integrase
MNQERKRRRDRGSGGIRQRKNGTWEGRVSHGVDSPIVYVYGNTKKDVIEKIRTEQARPRADNEDKRVTLEEWLTKWLDLVEHDSSLSRSTYDVYKHKANHYIIPQLGSTRLSSLKAGAIYGMLDKLAKAKTGGRTTQVVFGVLRRALEVARKRGLIAANPALDVDMPRHRAKERVYLRSIDEIKTFVEAADKSPLRALFIVGLDTGCRLGELLALQWADVDEKNAVLHVRATLTRGKDGKLVATRPKTATSVRSIKLPASSIEALKAHHKDSMNAGKATTWVFHDDNGQPMRRDGLVRCELSRIGTAIGKPGLSSHSLRHSSVSLLMSRGVDLRTIQTRIGHSTPRLTLSLYSHAMLTAQDSAVSVLDEVHRSIRQADQSVSGTISGMGDKTTPSENSEIPQTLAG